MLGPLTCAVVQAAWFWPALKEPSSFAEVSATATEAMREEPDLSPEIGKLSLDLARAIHTGRSAAMDTARAADDSIRDVTTLSTEANSLAAKTLGYSKQVGDALGTVSGAADSADEAIEAVIDTEMTQGSTERAENERLRQKAADTNLRMQINGQARLTNIKSDYDTNAMETKSAYQEFVTEADRLALETQTLAKTKKAGYEITYNTLQDNLKGWLKTEQTHTDTVRDLNRDFEKVIKDETKEILGDNKDLLGDIKDIDSDDRLMHYKKWQKEFRKMQKYFNGEFEDTVEDAQDAYSDLTKQGAKDARNFDKDARRQLKTFTKLVEKGTSAQAKSIRDQSKQTLLLAKGLDRQESNIVSLGTALSQDSSDFTMEVGEVGHRAAVAIGDMANDVAGTAARTLQDTQTAAEAMKSEMAEENSKLIEDLTKSESANVEQFRVDSQTRAFDMNKQVSDVATVVAEAAEKAKEAAKKTADTTSEVEVASLKATDHAAEGKRSAGRYVDQMNAEVARATGDHEQAVRNFEGSVNAAVSNFKANIKNDPLIVAGPIETQSNDLARDLESQYTEDSMDYTKKLNTLFNGYKKVSHMMQAMGVSPNGGVAITDASAEISSWEQAMVALEQAIPSMTTKLHGEQAQTTLVLGVKAKALENYARDEASAMQIQKKKSLNDIQHTAFTAIGSIARKITAQIGMAETVSTSGEQNDAYMEHQVSSLNTDLGAGEQVYATMSAALKAKLSDCYTLLSDHKSALTTAGADAREAIQRALNEVQEQQTTFLTNFASAMLGSARSNEKAQTQAIKNYEATILSHFESSSSNENAKLAGLNAKLEDIKYNNDDLISEMQKAQLEAGDQAEEMGAVGMVESASLAGKASGMEDNIEEMETSAAENTKQSINAWLASDDKDLDHIKSLIGPKVHALAAESGTVFKLVDGELVQVSGEYQDEAMTTEAVAKHLEKLAAEGTDALKNFVEGFKAHIEMDEENAKDGAQAVAQGDADDERHSKDDTNRLGELFGVMLDEAHNIGSETGMKADVILNKFQADIKAVTGEISNDVGASGVVADSAKLTLSQAELDLTTAQGHLKALMKSVQDQLTHQVSATTGAADNIAKQTATERTMLDNNVNYLHQYDLTVQSACLSIIESMTHAIEGAAEASMDRYKKVQDEIDELKRSVLLKTSSSSFATLSSIMEADEYAQKSSIENANVVTYIQDFKSDQEKFIKRLLDSLEDAQYWMILHEEETQYGADKISGDASALTKSVIDSIKAMIANRGTDDDAQALENMSGATLKMLLLQATTGSTHDKAMVQALLNHIELHGTAGLEHLTNAKGIIDTINELAGSNTNYDLMKADLQRTVDLNQKMVDDERRRMEARGIEVSDQIFFKGRGVAVPPRGFDHVPQATLDAHRVEAEKRVKTSYDRAAFLERERREIVAGTSRARKALLAQEAGANATAPERQQAQRLRALLEQNERLVGENHELELQHGEISQAIQSADVQIRAIKAKASPVRAAPAPSAAPAPVSAAAPAPAHA